MQGWATRADRPSVASAARADPSRRGRRAARSRPRCRVYRDLLGLPARDVMDIESDRVRIAFLGVGESKVELVQPTDDTTGVARFLANKGEGFHHVCFEVANLTEELTRLGIEGVELIDTAPRARRRGAGGVPPPAELPRRARRADRGARRSGLAQPRLPGLASRTRHGLRATRRGSRPAPDRRAGRSRRSRRPTSGSDGFSSRGNSPRSASRRSIHGP